MQRRPIFGRRRREERMSNRSGAKRRATSRKISVAAVLGVALQGLLCLDCGGGLDEPKPPRLVLLYATCSLARTSLSPWSDDLPYTPNLEAFAKEALVFDRHHTESGQSGIAFASLFTGTQQALHGIYSHPAKLPLRNVTLAERFAAAGWETHSWLKHLMANAKLGYAQGVPKVRQHDGRLEADAEDFLDLLDRLSSDPSAHALAMTNFTVTHGPYRGRQLDRFCRTYPERCDAAKDRAAFRADSLFYQRNHLALSFDFETASARFGIDAARRERLRTVIQILYEADVHLLDTMFGAVLDRIDAAGLADETLVIFTVDHGEIADRENAPYKWTHGFQQAPEVLHIPLIIRGPGVGIEPGRYRGVTRSIDVAPTVEALAGLVPRPIASDPRLVGRDLTKAIRATGDADVLPAYMHTAMLSRAVWDQHKHLKGLASRYPERGPDHAWASLREGDLWWTLRRPPGGEFGVGFYDLSADSGLTQDRFDPANPEHAATADRLREYKSRLVDAYADRRRRARGLPTAEEKRRLCALGYIECDSALWRSELGGK